MCFVPVEVLVLYYLLALTALFYSLRGLIVVIRN